jgi:hypothetical protein
VRRFFSDRAMVAPYSPLAFASKHNVISRTLSRAAITGGGKFFHERKNSEMENMPSKLWAAGSNPAGVAKQIRNKSRNFKRLRWSDSCAAREPGSHTSAAGFWVPGSPHPISGLPQIGAIDAHSGYSRCAIAPRNAS